MTGFLDVLNCGAGHLRIDFDKGNQADVDKARRVITDMLKRGYLLFVEIDGEQHRVHSFDAERCEYILKDPSEVDEPTPTPSEASHETLNQKEAAPAETANSEKPAAVEPLKPVRNGRGKRLGMRGAKATGIAPTAGG